MRRWSIIAVLIASACSPLPPTPASPTPGAIVTATPAARPASVASSPTAEPTSRPGIRTAAAGAIPESFRYVALELPIADGFHTRLWLVDLAGRRAPSVVAEWDAPAGPVGGYSASADGRAVIVSAAGTRARVALYLVRPETGDVRVLFEDPPTVVISPRISPDGQRVAFTKYPAQGGSDGGVWSGSTGGGDLRQIADRTTATNVPAMPLAWSVDSAWLAFTRELEDRTEVRLVGRDGGAEIDVGPGDKASWRARAPELLVASSSASGGSSVAAGRAYTFDLAARKATDVVRGERSFIPYVQWHPSLDRFAYVEAEGPSRDASGGVWIRNADGGAPSRVDLGAGRGVSSPQWSADGSLLTALVGGDDVVVPVVDLLTGKRITVLCRRGGTPPGDCF